MRIGQGYDVHRLVPGRKLILGGVEIPYEFGLEGHSDADVLTHALCDALLGALGLGDLGAHFPDTSEEWRGADSLDLLRRVVEMGAEAGYSVVNADVTLLAEKPEIRPHVPAMRKRLARKMGISPGRVSVKATTTEGLGPVGRKEGMAALAVVLMDSAG